MDLQLKNKIVLVTGGAKGIGEAIVRTLAAEGAVPVIADRDVEIGNRLHQQVAGSDLIIVELSQAEGCYAAVQKTRQTAVDEGLDPDGDVVWSRIMEVTGG